MKICRQLSLEPRVYDFNVKINLTISPESLPILIPQKSLQVIQENDNSPYYVTEEIEDITEPANGVEFTPEFWKTYFAAMKERPIPGRKKGHLNPYSWETPENDFYTIGGKLEGNKVFLRIYIPPEGFETSNKGLIRDAKAGLVNFSIVSWTEDIIETDENGEIKSIKAIRSVKGERNDRVEVGLGAMPQKVNKNTGDNPDNKSKKTEEYIMDDSVYTDIVKNLQNQVDNGTVSKLRLATDLKIEIATPEMKEAEKQLKEIILILGDNPIEKIKQLKADEKSVKQEKYDNIREKLMTQEFGPEKIDGKDNLKRSAADPHVLKTIQDEKTLKEQIAKAKRDPVVLNISFQQADVNSKLNDMSGGIKIDKNSGHRKETIKA